VSSSSSVREDVHGYSRVGEEDNRGTFSDFEDDSEDELADMSVKGGAKQPFKRSAYDDEAPHGINDTGTRVNEAYIGRRPAATSPPSPAEPSGQLPQQIEMPPPPPVNARDYTNSSRVGVSKNDKSGSDITVSGASNTSSHHLSNSFINDPVGRVRVATQLLLESLEEQGRLRALLQLRDMTDEDISKEIGGIDPSRRLLSVLSELERVVQQVRRCMPAYT
jgi:hypothetical protein